MTKWAWHSEGLRAFILEDDGSTVCELICPGQNNRIEVARQIVHEHNELIDAYAEICKQVSGSKVVFDRDLVERAKEFTK